MSREGYQRAMGDLLRSPQLCRAVRAGADEVWDGYDLTPTERGQLHEVARHRGMVVNCMLYRASRLVGILRRLPGTVAALGPDLRSIFDAYVEACPDAPAEFDAEARSFARFLAAQLGDPGTATTLNAGPLRATLDQEAATLAA
jgi:hypothetical protein